jgi:hypothetical protein
VVRPTGFAYQFTPTVAHVTCLAVDGGTFWALTGSKLLVSDISQLTVGQR